MPNPIDETKSTYNPNMKEGSEQLKKNPSGVSDADAKKEKDEDFNQKK